MENTKFTKKYVLASQALLVAAVLFVASPALALADDVPTEIGFTYDPVTEIGFTYDPITEAGVIPAGEGFVVDQPTEIGSNPTLAQMAPNGSSPAIVSGGGFSGGSMGYTSYSYGLLSNLTVSNGGFSGGSPANPRYNYPSAPTTAISNGGFSGGNSTNVASNYPLVQNSTVSSGGNNYVPLTQSYFPNNQILAANDTPNLSSVYLSDVPYTGAGDVLKVILFTLSLILWSALIAYVILKKKQNNQEVFAGVANTDETQNNLFNMSSDNKALENIENYARENKILLSTSASVKLLKLERLSQINTNDLITKISKDEWICVGESDLEKYL